MNGLFALIEREKTPSYILEEHTDHALQTLSHRGGSARELFLFDEDHIINLRESDQLALFSIATCFSTDSRGKYYAEHDNVRIVFEGRLFNRNKLSETISDYNGEATCNFDVDIVLELFLRHRTNAFALLEGYWSLIIADQNEKKIYAARDHFGNRPIYYCQTDTQFGIASESRTLFSILKNAGQINKDAVFDYLLWGDIAKHRQNFFSDIHLLKPSCYIVYSLNDNTLEESSYYILPYKNCKGGYNEYEEPFYIDKVRHLVFESIRNNIGDKNRIAIGLSGGMDSSTLLCCAKKNNPELQITAFTSTDSYDGGEVFWAEKVVKHTNVDWIKVSCNSQQVLNQLEEINKVQNVPVFNPSTIAQYNIMEAVKQHGFDVVMDGQGSDELFAGYTSYFLPFFKALRSQWMFNHWGRELIHIHNSNISYRDIFSRKLKSLAKEYYYNEKRLAKKLKFKELELLNEQYKNNYFLSLNEASKEKSVLNDYLYESYTVFLPYILRWGEHSAASFGMDCVMPFSDSIELAEYVFSIPSTFKIHNGWNKYLLRSSMVGIVPDEIRWRKQKLGFYVPEMKWLNEIGEKIKNRIYQLNDPDGFINKDSLIRNWQTLYNPDNFQFQQFAFRYYSYLLWRNEFYKELS